MGASNIRATAVAIFTGLLVILVVGVGLVWHQRRQDSQKAAQLAESERQVVIRQEAKNVQLQAAKLAAREKQGQSDRRQRAISCARKLSTWVESNKAKMGQGSSHAIECDDRGECTRAVEFDAECTEEPLTVTFFRDQPGAYRVSVHLPFTLACEAFPSTAIAEWQSSARRPSGAYCRLGGSASANIVLVENNERPGGAVNAGVHIASSAYLKREKGFVTAIDSDVDNARSEGRIVAGNVNR